MAQNETRSDPRRPQEEPKTKRDKKAKSNHKTKKGPNQDDPKTVLDCPRADLPSSAALPGAHLGPQNDTKTDPKTMKNRSEKLRRKKATQDDLGPVLERSWVDLGPILGSILSKNHWKTQCFVKNHFFEDKSVRRRFRDQLGPKKAPT